MITVSFNNNKLIDFLNQVLGDRERIQDLTYLNTENLGNTEIDRKAIFDLYCENEKGEKFIIELQNVKQQFFKDRSIFYSTFPIQSQAPTPFTILLSQTIGYFYQHIPSLLV